MLTKAGLDVTEWFGDWTGKPFEPLSREIIPLGRTGGLTSTGKTPIARPRSPRGQDGTDIDLQRLLRTDFEIVTKSAMDAVVVLFGAPHRTISARVLARISSGRLQWTPTKNRSRPSKSALSDACHPPCRVCVPE